MRPNEKDTVVCPSCQARRVSLLDYESLMVLRADLGLFALQCPNCHTKFSVLKPIPHILSEDIEFAAIEMGAGMGHKLG